MEKKYTKSEIESLLSLERYKTTLDIVTKITSVQREEVQSLIERITSFPEDKEPEKISEEDLFLKNMTETQVLIKTEDQDRPIIIRGGIPLSKISKEIQNSREFKSLIDSGTIQIVPTSNKEPLVYKEKSKQKSPWTSGLSKVRGHGAYSLPDLFERKADKKEENKEEVPTKTVVELEDDGRITTIKLPTNLQLSERAIIRQQSERDRKLNSEKNENNKIKDPLDTPANDDDIVTAISEDFPESFETDKSIASQVNIGEFHANAESVAEQKRWEAVRNNNKNTEENEISSGIMENLWTSKDFDKLKDRMKITPVEQLLQEREQLWQERKQLITAARKKATAAKSKKNHS